MTGLGDHLWQSTLFGAVAALLALALRNNRAQVRYCLWLLASVKFLLPFSLAVALVSHFELRAPSPVVRPVLSVAVHQISQPFTVVPAPLLGAMPSLPGRTNYLPVILFAVWACGAVAVSISWLRSWLKIQRAVRRAAPLPFPAPIRIVSSSSLLEPGIFGIFCPVLLLPQGITGHLDPEHLEAILAHELCHARRHDNLAAAIHMLVEVLFWFHPLVWWIGSRMVEEREHACDEEVLQLGSRRDIYAESILKTCQFYLGSPIPCVSGVTGSDLKRRITRIMTQGTAVRLTFPKKLLLAAAAITTVMLPLAVGVTDSPASFEVASVKPTAAGSRGVMIRLAPGGRFTANGVTPKLLIEEAYDLKDSQLSGAPEWLNTERYDIEAKPDDVVGAAIDKLSPEERKHKIMQMMQSLLTERFQLTLGHNTKELPVYNLVVAKSGPKMKASTFTPSDKAGPLPALPKPGSPPPSGGIWMKGPGDLTSTGIDMPMLASMLSRFAGRIVLDKTGLPGRYDFTLQFTPEDGQGFMPGGGPPPEGAPPLPQASGPSLFTALQEQLGLKLESDKAPMDVLVIEHVEKPSEN